MKEIPLTQGKFALVDDEDFEWLSQWKWCLHKGGYAVRGFSQQQEDGTRKNIIVLMHRVVNNTPEKFFADHINGNKLDNRRCNLRSVTNQQNCMNQKKRPNKTTLYKGASFDKIRKNFKSNIRINGRNTFLGRYKTAEEAAKAYNEAAIKYHGEFALINVLP